MRFANDAQQAFSFLENKGLKLTRHTATRLQYESDRSVVIIEWDVRSGEINVLIALQPKKGEPQDAFSLTDILEMLNVDVPERWMPFQVANEDGVAPFLEKLAEDARLHAQSALDGDRVFFRRLETFRSAKSQAYMRDMELRRVRSDADNAWRNQELDKLIHLYTAIEEDLSQSEKRRLDYAQKHKGK